LNKSKFHIKYCTKINDKYTYADTFNYFQNIFLLIIKDIAFSKFNKILLILSVSDINSPFLFY